MALGSSDKNLRAPSTSWEMLRKLCNESLRLTSFLFSFYFLFFEWILVKGFLILQLVIVRYMILYMEYERYRIIMER
jgi:hypothetical protein